MESGQSWCQRKTRLSPNHRAALVADDDGQRLVAGETPGGEIDQPENKRQALIGSFPQELEERPAAKQRRVARPPMIEAALAHRVAGIILALGLLDAHGEQNFECGVRTWRAPEPERPRCRGRPPETRRRREREARPATDRDDVPNDAKERRRCGRSRSG